MTELTKSVKRLIDLIYVYAAFWGFAKAIEWIMMFGS
jgi:hypothetical protein